MCDVFAHCYIFKRMHHNRETIEIRYKGENIAQILNIKVKAAAEFFKAVPTIVRKLRNLLDVGLSYIKLGQAGAAAVQTGYFPHALHT